MKSHCLIYSTAPTKKEAAFIAKKLVEQRLAACVNLFPKMEAVYQWRSKIERTSECALLIKTQRKHFKKITQYIQKNHSYSVPAIVEIPLNRVEKTFAKWVLNETT